MNMPPLILLAGGLGKRLGEVSETLPKSLIEIAGEPFIAHQMRLFKREGIQKVIVCAGYLGEAIEKQVGDGASFGLEINFSFDGEELIGTGGAVQKALEGVVEDNVWIMYGDTYLDISFAPIFEFFNQQNKPGVMTVFKNANQWDKSNVVLEDKFIKVYSKEEIHPQMDYIDYGLSILSRQAFFPWQTGEVFDLQAVYERMLEKGDLLGYEVPKRFYEIGSPQGLEETRKYLNRGRAAHGPSNAH